MKLWNSYNLTLNKLEGRIFQGKEKVQTKGKPICTHGNIYGKESYKLDFSFHVDKMLTLHFSQIWVH